MSKLLTTYQQNCRVCVIDVSVSNPSTVKITLNKAFTVIFKLVIEMKKRALMFCFVGAKRGSVKFWPTEYLVMVSGNKSVENF